MTGKCLITLLLIMALVSTGLVFAAELTGDEILARMADSFSRTEGSDEKGIILTLRLHNEYANGVTNETEFAVFGRKTIDPTKKEKADETAYALMVFLTGDDAGSIFLTMTPEAEDEKARMWLYLPALGMTKELVSEEEKGMSFAGSTMSYGNIGGSTEWVDNYTATIVKEDSLSIGGVARAVWVLHLSKRPDAKDEVDYPTMRLWVDKEDYLALGIQGYNDQGNLEMEMESLALGNFEGELTIDELVSRNVLEGDSSTVTFQGRKRPQEELPASLFDPATLEKFNPAQYGF